jgi:hypothetical protein
MPRLRKAHLVLLILAFAALSLSTEAKADAVSLTLTPTTYDVGSGLVPVFGFFTSLGNLTFHANNFDVIFPPGTGLTSIGAIEENGTFTYTRPVLGMSPSPVVHLLNFFFSKPTPPGTYSFTVTFSGFDSSGVPITTTPAQFTVTVPVGWVPNITTPEPTTVILLTTGLATLGASIRSRRNSTKK